jgi:hypothetical protein
MEKELLRAKLLVHPIVTRLLNNPNWEPAARAAVSKLVDDKNCPVVSWRKSSTWQQVQLAYDEINAR